MKALWKPKRKYPSEKEKTVDSDIKDNIDFIIEEGDSEWMNDSYIQEWLYWDWLETHLGEYMVVTGSVGL